MPLCRPLPLCSREGPLGSHRSLTEVPPEFHRVCRGPTEVPPSSVDRPSRGHHCRWPPSRAPCPSLYIFHTSPAQLGYKSPFRCAGNSIGMHGRPGWNRREERTWICINTLGFASEHHQLTAASVSTGKTNGGHLVDRCKSS